MAELLRDNLEAQRRGALHESPSTSSSNVGRHRREVPDLLSWVQCFGIYAAVVASRYPERVQKLLAYQTLIIREARRCGGRGWLSYDSYFRQQMTGEWRGDEWGRLNPYLFSSTFLAFGNSNRQNCVLCLESDHQEEECALSKAKNVDSLPKHLITKYQGIHHGILCLGQVKGSLPVQWCAFPGTRGNAHTPIASSVMSASGAGVIIRSFVVALLCHRWHQRGVFPGRRMQRRFWMGVLDHLSDGTRGDLD